MGHKIGVIAQKGGVGKSAVSRCLGAAHAGFGWDVKIGDLDIKQSTSYVWHKRRLASEIKPFVAVECFGTVSQAMKQANHYDLFIFDDAAHSTRATLEIAQISDMVVIPTGLCLDDMEPCVILANDLVKNGVDKDKIVIVFCRTGDDKDELDESLQYMAQTPYTTIPHPMPEKKSIRRAHEAGLAAIETRYKGPRDAAEKMTQALIDKLDELTK